MNASNSVSASIVGSASYISEYFGLRNVNKVLAEENSKLRQMLFHLTAKDSLSPLPVDTMGQVLKAKVVDNTLFFRNNYLVIDKGLEEGVFEGQGVMGPDGIVGKVQRVSDHYATVLSLLHSKTLISARHNNSNYLCSVVWDGNSPYQASVSFLPRHLKVSIGDTVTTSGFNSVYTEDALIGVVEEVGIGSDATFYDVKIQLSSNFSELSYVYLLNLKGREEIDSLKTESQRDG